MLIKVLIENSACEGFCAEHTHMCVVVDDITKYDDFKHEQTIVSRPVVYCDWKLFAQDFSKRFNGFLKVPSLKDPELY